MNNHLVVHGIIILFICVGFSGCVYQDQGFDVEKLDVIPDDYYSMTEEEFELFPHLKEAIIQCNITGNAVSVSAPREEHNRANDFFSHTCVAVEYQNEYYEVTLFWED